MTFHYGAISGISVPGKNAFSIAGYMTRETRSSLKTKNLKYSIFLKNKFNSDFYTWMNPWRSIHHFGRAVFLLNGLATLENIVDMKGPSIIIKILEFRFNSWIYVGIFSERELVPLKAILKPFYNQLFMLHLIEKSKHNFEEENVSFISRNLSSTAFMWKSRYITYFIGATNSRLPIS